MAWYIVRTKIAGSSPRVRQYHFHCMRFNGSINNAESLLTYVVFMANRFRARLWSGIRRCLQVNMLSQQLSSRQHMELTGDDELEGVMGVDIDVVPTSRI